MRRIRFVCNAQLAFVVIFTPILGTANCLQPVNKAILDSSPDTNYLGGSYCRKDGDVNFPVRGIRNPMAFETGESVCIDLRPPKGPDCRKTSLPDQITLTVENVGGDNFRAGLGNGIEVNLRPYPHGSSVAYWPHGKVTINKDEYEVFLYLLDEPQASADIYKRYRLELFNTSDSSCKDQPVSGTNFWLKSTSHICDVVPPSPDKQTGSGDGYEPKK